MWVRGRRRSGSGRGQKAEIRRRRKTTEPGTHKNVDAEAVADNVPAATGDRADAVDQENNASGAPPRCLREEVEERPGE